MLSLYVIGCGGIGGYLLSELMENIASIDLDNLDRRISKEGFEHHLENFGKVVMPSIVDRIVLVDGDTYSPRNALRQGHASGSKLDNWVSTLDKKAIRKTYFRTTDIIGYNLYLNPDNMEKVIQRFPGRNPANTGGCLGHGRACTSEGEIAGHTYPGYRDMPVIFLCVDNAKTRYEVSKYAETFNDILVINGGNEKTWGQVTVYERRDGIALDPNLPDLFPNVKADTDLRPDEVDPCTHIAPKHDQVADTNEIVAVFMRKLFSIWIRGGLNVFGPHKTDRRNDFIIDLETFESDTLYHPPKIERKTT